MEANGNEWNKICSEAIFYDKKLSAYLEVKNGFGAREKRLNMILKRELDKLERKRVWEKKNRGRLLLVQRRKLIGWRKRYASWVRMEKIASRIKELLGEMKVKELVLARWKVDLDLMEKETAELKTALEKLLGDYHASIDDLVITQKVDINVLAKFRDWKYKQVKKQWKLGSDVRNPFIIGSLRAFGRSHGFDIVSAD